MNIFWLLLFIDKLYSRINVFKNQITNDEEDDDLDLSPVPFLNKKPSHKEDDLKLSLNCD